MSHRSKLVAATAVLGTAALLGSLTGCSSGGTSGDSGSTTITFQTFNDTASVATAKQLASAFEKANPSVTVKVESRPGGTDGDNLVKTQLSTGEGADVINYNSGSLLQALNPDKSLVDLSSQSWQTKVDDGFKKVVSTDNGNYGAPFGTSFAGGVMYNKKVYEKLGLSVPTSWDQFISNSEKIKAAGITPVEQTYGDTWTSQLFILADFASITAQQSDWATKYTAHKESYADQPALAGWQHIAEVKNKDLLNKDYASATQANGLKALSDGSAAQYPMLTNAISAIQQDSPSAVNDIGVFALPADDGADTRLTMWEPNALYIPKTTTDAKLTAAKKLVAFANSSAGCKVQNEAGTPGGPFVISTCTLPSSAPSIVSDVETYIKGSKASSALEFLSPIKGPNLEKIAIQVGSGTASATEGAKQYDQDVVQQAQQLGIKGW